MFSQTASTTRIRDIRNYIESADRMLQDTAIHSEPIITDLQEYTQRLLMLINTLLVTRAARELGVSLSDESAPESTDEAES